MAKLTKSVIKAITTAFYGAGYAMHSWAQDAAEHRFESKGTGSVTKYYYRGFMLDLVPIAEVMQDCTVRINQRKTFEIPLSQLFPAMATSVLHHENIRTNCYSVQVRSLEMAIFNKFKDISQYIDVYLGEYEDVILGCSRREVIVRVKEEFKSQINLTFRHTLVDKLLAETTQSRKVRNERRFFSNH